MAFVKLVVTGPFNVGKTSFVGAVNEIRGVNTEVRTRSARSVKPQTTVAMDFGRVTLSNGRKLHLFGTPGQRRFAFMWETLIVECNGILMLVDSSDPDSLVGAGEMFDFFAARCVHPQSQLPGTGYAGPFTQSTGQNGHGVPMFVVANKQDVPGALSPQQVGEKLNLVYPGPGEPLARRIRVSADAGCQGGRVVALLPPLGCVAEDRASVMSVLETIAARLATRPLGSLPAAA
jgi:signal recognition particle receptor subunit beta